MLNRMKELNKELKKAAKAYYEEGVEIISNYQYDKMYDELLELEKKTNTILADSITQKVGYEIVSKLEKEKHAKKMLSLDKTKDKDALKEWLGNKKGVLSFKEDGLTCVLTYENGTLIKAVTRGNGEVGEIITHNAKFFNGVPVKIDFKDKLIVRGEALISYSEFNRINDKIEDADSKYKNPRNLASGTIRQLDANMMKDRNVDFCAFTLVLSENKIINSYKEQLDFLATLGFQVVDNVLVDETTLFDKMNEFEAKIATNNFPSDGLVLFYDDVEYGKSLGETSKFPRNGIAFKWQDETQDTVLREIEWSASRTGLLNPVAIFDSVELEGTTVSRASLHNVSYIEDLQLNILDEISIYKANMIIPQIAENKTKSLKDIHDVVPTQCPICGGVAEIRQENGTKALYCVNDKCPAKHIKKFVHFAKRDALDITGLSDSTIEKLINIGAINDLKDLYHLDAYKDEIINIEGLGEKTYNNLITNIEASRNVRPDKFLYSLGIENIGRSVSKDILKYCDQDINKIFELTAEELSDIEGIGEIIALSLVSYLKDHTDDIKELMKEMKFEVEVTEHKDTLAGKTFVITGKVEHYANRDELKAYIETLGGKVSGSVSAKTSYLINNDKTSTSGKNKKAKELNIEIISEEDFMKMI